MNLIKDLITKQISNQVMSKLGDSVGADSNSTQSALSTALPLIMGALGRNASTPQGAQQLDQALERSRR